MKQRPTYVRQLASELEMLAHGSTTSWSPGNGIPDSRPPSGDANPPHVQMLADWDRNGDRVLAKWLDVLNAWRGCGRVRPAGKSDREIVLDAGKGFSAKDVADRYRLTPTIVRKWRREAGVNEETGQGESVVAKARRLREEGVPVRQVASAVGTHPTQVQRWTGKRAA